MLRPALLGLTLLSVLFLALGCAQGSYPLDIFYEMHYQKSFKAHEPPRLSVPETAVAWFPPPQSTVAVPHMGPAPLQRELRHVPRPRPAGATARCSSG